MRDFYYDFHIHSCLSPCGSNDSTPASIAGFGVLNQLDILALTDHNSCSNCPAFFKAAHEYGIVPVAGMELTTSEDIHLVCLFKTLDAAMEFDNYVKGQRIPVKNREDIFGEQLIMDENDEVIGRDEFLLINATGIALDDAPSIVGSYDGICYPAHIDREANGIISILGTFPDEPRFSCAELNDSDNLEILVNDYPILKDIRLVFSSDAHYLQDINGRTHSFELSGESEKEILDSLFLRLGQK